MKLHVTPLSGLNDTIARTGARNVVCLCGPGRSIERPSEADGGFLSLTFNDIDEPRDGLIAPSDEHVAQIIDHVRSAAGQDQLLFVCWMGISRSTAACLIATCVMRPDLSPRTVTGHLRRESPSATPNRLMVYLADQALGLDGQLLSARDAIGRGADAFEGTPFTLDTDKIS